MDNEQVQKQILQTATENQFNPSPTTAHTHNGTDSLLITRVDLPTGTPIKLGLGGIFSTSNNKPAGDTDEAIQTSIVSGRDQAGAITLTTDNMQFNLIHQPQGTVSYLSAVRPPIYTNIPGTTISTTLGGNTVTTAGYGFTTNILANALINIYNSSGALVETQSIASNTATVITINGTWLATTSGGSLLIFIPVYLGISQTPFQRVYIQESTDGGVRFGVGTTNGGQNGLLYMDSTGNLYWRNKSGTSTQLDSGVASNAGVGSAPTTSSTQTITHGLGRAPAIVRIHCIGGMIGSAVAQLTQESFGVYNASGGNNHCVYIRGLNPATTSLNPAVASGTCVQIEDSAQNTGSALVQNVTSTTFDLVWTVSADISTVKYMWEAQ